MKYKINPADQTSFGCNIGYLSQAINITTHIDFSSPTSKTSKQTTYTSSADGAYDDNESEDSEADSHSLCEFHCDVVIPHNKVCTAEASDDDKNASLIFWLYASVKISSSFSVGITYTLFEVATIAVLKQYGNDYGLQRIYGSIGGIVFAPLAGLIVDSVGDGGTYRDY